MYKKALDIEPYR